jgi:hypothetical protein
MEPRETGLEDLDFINVVQDKDKRWTLVNMVMKLQSP